MQFWNSPKFKPQLTNNFVLKRRAICLMPRCIPCLGIQCFTILILVSEVTNTVISLQDNLAHQYYIVYWKISPPLVVPIDEPHNSHASTWLILCKQRIGVRKQKSHRAVTRRTERMEWRLASSQAKRLLLGFGFFYLKMFGELLVGLLWNRWEVGSMQKRKLCCLLLKLVCSHTTIFIKQSG